ncbi:pyruvate, water dikinase regulatory protein [Limisalsivibrio acetivorans]|uniref:pyruvate, water dikinase regulatory protein n=1 Tax=Limisalsivibrio acetivorans TaxID=1304888 RepID=UPI0003B7B1F1|nr:pyruvate, water dikinase regulatory protein [Limisalsivibrio acetivorans]
MKRIYIVSDGTGQSAMNIMRAALLQFDEPDVKFTIYSNVDSIDKLKVILEHAKLDNGFVAFTTVMAEFRKTIHEFCHENEILHFDILGPPINKLKTFLEKTPSESPGRLRKVDEKYFRRIDALEYTLSHDDGKITTGLDEADIIILGLSRTSKTPTSFFLAQQGFRVVNIPLVKEIPIPEEVFRVDQNKVVCLIMDPEVLQKVRTARLRHYRTNSSYTDMKKIFDEVEFVYELIRKNRRWHIIDTTNKSIEETAREIIHSVIGRDIEL